MKRLLCIVGGMNAGGAETFLMKLYRGLDKSKYQMDFCVSKPQKGFYDDEILSMGGKIYHVKAKSKNPFASFKSIYKIVKENNYNYVMRVSQHSLSALELLAAKFGGAKVRVFRSSNSKTMKGGLDAFLHRIFKFLPNCVANVKIAPSIPAAQFMFSKRNIKRGNILYLNNGIALDKFSFSSENRKKIREELGLIDETLLGHIGRFAPQKNHATLIKIFSEYAKTNSEAHLMLVGEGELEDDIRNQIKQLGIADKVHFMGIRKDIPALLSAMDVFVFPSLYEGMPNTVIEAQANGLPCIIADTVTPEVVICKNVTMLSLSDLNSWVNAIDSAKRVPSNRNQESLRENGYDIDNVCQIFVKAVFEKKD